MKNVFPISIFVFAILTGCGGGKENTEVKNNVTQDSVAKSTEVKSINFLAITNADDFPSWLEIKIDGTISYGAKWKDGNNENVFFIITKPSTKNIFLTANHYLLKNNVADLIWSVSDSVVNCSSDANLNYFPGSLSITDINKDDIAEIAFGYTQRCGGEKKEDNLRYLLRANNESYIIDGTTRIFTDNKYIGGEKKRVDEKFKTAPVELLNYANKRWDELIVENTK